MPRASAEKTVTTARKAAAAPAQAARAKRPRVKRLGKTLGDTERAELQANRKNEAKLLRDCVAEIVELIKALAKALGM